MKGEDLRLRAMRTTQRALRMLRESRLGPLRSIDRTMVWAKFAAMAVGRRLADRIGELEDMSKMEVMEGEGRYASTDARAI